MKELWRRTVELIRRYPVLWLPVIWAAFLSYGWEQLRLIILHDVLPSVLRRQSVLGGSVADTSPLRVHIFFILSLINTNVLHYADVCCYVAALLITAKMLGRLTATDPQHTPYADISIASHWTGVLWLGFLTYVIAIGVSVVAVMPVLYSANSMHRLSITGRPYVVAPEIFVMYAVLAYFVTPMALRLLARSGKRAVEGGEIATGRVCSLPAGAAIATLSFIWLSMPKAFDPNLLEKPLIGLFSTVLLALPYTPLFIALSLLAAGAFDLVAPLEDVSGAQPYGEPSPQPE